MKLHKVGPTHTVRMFILPGALALLGLAYFHSLGAGAQLIDSSGQSYYDNAKPLLDLPLPDLLKVMPELQGLEPAGSQDELAPILNQAGKVTEDMLDSMPDLISRENVLQAKLINEDSVKDQVQHEFDYLTIIHRQDAKITFEEFRGAGEGNALPATGLEQGYMLTQGFASGWLHFLPSNRAASRFRYLGQQTESGRKYYVVAFAQKPGWASVTGKIVSPGKSMIILFQGAAWIDTASFRIIRLRTDLLAPCSEFGLERETTEVHFSETRLPQITSPFWLPQEVVLTAQIGKQLYRNVHRYTNYRMFRVETRILSGPPPDLVLPKNPN